MNFLEIFDQLKEPLPEKNRDSRILLIDGTNSWIRIFSSVPTISTNGDHIGGILGFLRSIGSNIRDFNPTRCIIVFDGKGGSLRRRKLFPEYKQNRTGKYSLRREFFTDPEQEQIEMKRQLLRSVQYLLNLPVQILTVDNVEADDVIAFLSKQYFEPKGSCIRIVSTDRDFLQLLNPNIEVYSPVKKKLYNEDEIIKEFGLFSKNYLLYRMIDGDNSDNINGVKGIGIKTLLKEIPVLSTEEITLDSLFEIVNERVKSDKKLKNVFRLISENKPLLERNYKLMQLNDVDISFDSINRIKSLIEQPIPTIDKVKIRQYIAEDYLQEHFKNLDSWLQNTFTTLNLWAKNE